LYLSIHIILKDTGLLVNGSIKKRHLATNETETSSRREQWRQERRENFREKWDEGKGEFHHGGNHTNGRINNVTLAQVVQPSFAKEEEEDPLFGCPQEDIVVCVNGDSEVGGSHVTCQAACGGKCCDYEGADACTGFTGRVCKDGYSCTGLDACKDADIDLVVGGCRGDTVAGFGACENADIKRGVIRGCIGEDGCKSAGGADGYVGRIKDGCVGDEACAYLANNDGFVGFVDNGCVGDEKVCYQAGGNNGRVGFIRNACKGKIACGGAGGAGFVGFIENSCTGKFYL